MKRILTILAFCLLIPPSFGWESNPDEFYNPMTREEWAVSRVLKSQVKYANNTNFKKYISTYDKDYKNSDGFDLHTYSQMVRDIWMSYENIKYAVDIKSIVVKDNSAEVKVVETATANLPINKNFNGELKSNSEAIYKLQNKNGKWKVIYDEVLDESTSMLYGEAKSLDIKLTVPNKIDANSEYCATLELTPPEQTIAIASISSDIVEFPQKPVQEVFRTIPEENILERLFTANNINANEYVVASIGLTRTDISDTSIKLSLTGFGYTIRRVNVVPAKENSSKTEEI